MAKKTPKQLMVDLIGKRWKLQEIRAKLMDAGYEASVGHLSNIQHGHAEPKTELSKGLAIVHKQMMRE